MSVSHQLRKDIAFVFEALKRNGWVLFFVLKSILKTGGALSELTNRADCISFLEKRFEGCDKNLDVFGLFAESAAKACLDNPKQLKAQDFEFWGEDKRLLIFLDEVIHVMSAYLSDPTGMYANKMSELEEWIAEDCHQILTQIRDAVQKKRRKQPGFVGKTKDMTFFFK